MGKHRQNTKRSPLQEVAANSIRILKANPNITKNDVKVLKKKDEVLEQKSSVRTADGSFVISHCSADTSCSTKIGIENNETYDEVNVSGLSPDSTQTFATSFGNDLNLAEVLLSMPDIANNYHTPGSSRYISKCALHGTASNYFEELNVSSAILVSIFKYLNKKDLCSAMMTCRRFYFAGCSSVLWESIDLSAKIVQIETIRALLDRGIEVIGLSGSTIVGSLSNLEMSLFSLNSPTKLTHIDFSKANFSETSTIAEVIARCSTLQAIAFENNLIDDDICCEIAKNSALKVISLPMCYGFTPTGVAEICKGCNSLIEANFAWSSLTSSHVDVLCRYLPPSLKRLDISGITEREALLDEDITDLIDSCPCLTDIDLSDSPSITEVSLKQMLSKLPHLKGITISRCYGIDVGAFMLAKGLSYFNVFGCVAENGQKILRRQLKNVRVSEICYTDIARPTRSGSRSYVWNKRVADIY